MEKLSLDYLIRYPKVKSETTPLLILLHGYGSNEEDLFSFANELPNELLIVSARAPQTLGFGGYAWYTIHFTESEGKFSDIPEALQAKNLIAKFIDEIQLKYNINPQNTFLLGFSQGTILSYAVVLNFPEKVQQIIALSGYLNTELLPKNLNEKDYSKLDIFSSHGSVDQVIPVEWGRKATEILTNLNIKNCYKEYPVGHGVSPQNFFDLKKWIADRIKK